MGEEDSQVAQVVASWAGDHSVVKSCEEIVSVAGRQIAWIESSRMGARKCLPICNCSCRRAVSINSVRSRAEHGNRLTRNFRHARKTNTESGAAVHCQSPGGSRFRRRGRRRAFPGLALLWRFGATRVNNRRPSRLASCQSSDRTGRRNLLIRWRDAPRAKFVGTEEKREDGAIESRVDHP